MLLINKEMQHLDKKKEKIPPGLCWRWKISKWTEACSLDPEVRCEEEAEGCALGGRGAAARPQLESLLCRGRKRAPQGTSCHNAGSASNSVPPTSVSWEHVFGASVGGSGTHLSMAPGPRSNKVLDAGGTEDEAGTSRPLAGLCLTLPPRKAGSAGAGRGLSRSSGPSLRQWMAKLDGPEPHPGQWLGGSGLVMG